MANRATSGRTYLKKVHPIKGRKDFFKWVIVTDGKIAKDYKGEEMYFQDKARAEDVKKAIVKVKAKLKAHSKKTTTRKTKK